MVRAAAIALFSLLACFAASAASAATPDGVWRIISDQDGKPQALIRIQTVGGALQGVLTASLRGESPTRVCDKCSGARQNKPIIGMEVLWGLRQDAGNPLHWAGGQILDPNSGSVYGAELTESGDGRVLTVRGFLGVSFLGRTQTWQRVQ